MSTHLTTVPPSAAEEATPATPEPRPLPTHVSEVDALRLDNFATRRDALNAKAAMLAAQLSLVQERQASIRQQIDALDAEYAGGLQAHLVAAYGVDPSAGDEVDVGTREIKRAGR